MLSSYFYSHYKTDLIPYLYDELDIDNKLQVAFTNTHMKILLMETHKGNHYVLTGSANLRSASCLEQFDFEENAELFNFYKEAFDSLIDKYKTIDYTKPKIVRGNKAWQAVQCESLGTVRALAKKSSGAYQRRVAYTINRQTGEIRRQPKR